MTWEDTVNCAGTDSMQDMINNIIPTMYNRLDRAHQSTSTATTIMSAQIRIAHKHQLLLDRDFVI